MYPSQTSLIPATVALLRFINETGISAFGMDYPYWYLGSTPYKYLIGPVVPLLEYLTHHVLPSLSIFSFVYLLIGLFLILGGVGWIILVKKVVGKKFPLPVAFYILLATVYLLFPFKYLSALAIAEATVTVAKSLIPFVMVAVWTYLVRRDKTWFVVSSLSVALLLLVSTSVLPTLIIGMVALCLTVSFKNGKIRHLDKKLKRAFLPFVVGLLLATMWYGPKFWWVQLVNPGIGGAAGFSAIYRIIDFLKNFVPLVLVVLVLNFSPKIKDRLTVFALTWTLTFFALSIFRFMANPEFWMDHTAWYSEIEIGLFLIAALYFQLHTKFQSPKSLIIPISLYLISIMSTFLVYTGLGKPKLVSVSPPIITESLKLTQAMPKDSRLYVTGVNTFWLNAFYNIVQVRGGRDEVAVNSKAIPGSYVFRENKDKEIVFKHLTDLKVGFVLINTKSSTDFYKDFKNLEVWDKMGSPESGFNGDYLLKVK